MKKVKISILFIITVSLLVLSCDMEKFPKDKNLQGHWVVKEYKVEKLELIFYENQTMDFIKQNSTLTFNYTLDKSSEHLILNSDLGTSSHKILWNKKHDEITVWDLFPSFPENPSVIVFVRE